MSKEDKLITYLRSQVKDPARVVDWDDDRGEGQARKEGESVVIVHKEMFLQGDRKEHFMLRRHGELCLKYNDRVSMHLSGCHHVFFCCPLTEDEIKKIAKSQQAHWYPAGSQAGMLRESYT